MPSGSRLALVSLLLVLAAGPVAAQLPGELAGGPHDRLDAGSGAIEVGGPGPAAVTTSDASTGNTTMRVQLTEDGDARWDITTTFNLTDEADRAAFDDLAESFESGQTTTEWITGFRQAASRAGRATGRDMRINSVRRSSASPANETGAGTGRLTLSLTWTEFAASSDGGQRLAVGDAFGSPSPPLLAELGPRETLVVVPPEGYTPVTGSGDLREGSFYWEGPQSFTDEPPSAVYRGNGGGPPVMLATLVVGGLGLLLVFVYLLANRRGTLGDDDESGTGVAATDVDTAEKADDGTASGVAEGGTSDAGDDEIDVELLSDEERVERLLDRNGGRMKQATIVKETGWSNAKVSQLLSAMEEDGRIDKLRIGRENLISFPDEDVADVED